MHLIFNSISIIFGLWNNTSAYQSLRDTFLVLGANDFFGSSKTVFFQPGEVEKNFVVIARDDSFPEVFILRPK